MTLKLRPYQREAIDATYAHWQAGGGNGLIVIPTGGGKSLIIAQLLKEMVNDYPLLRFGVITHSRELIAQNYQELLRIWPQAPAGVYSAGLGRRDRRAQIMFLGIQSVWNKVEQLGYFDLLLVDEAHLISRNAGTMYGKFIAAMLQRRADMRVLGLTATPYRLDSGRLDKGKDKLFEKIIYEANVRDLIDDGFLSKLISKHTGAEISTAGLHRRGGEWVPAELEAAAMSGDLVYRAAKEIALKADGRKAILAFCTGLDHAAALRDALRSSAIIAEMIDGGMNKGERDHLIAQFRKGAIRCLTSVNVLSIGFNVPHVDLIALLRPTESCGLYIQQVGRGFRLASGKENCLVLDFAGNVRKHGPVDDVAPAIGRDGGGESTGEAPTKVCPSCDSYVHPRVMICPDCGFEWEAKPKHEPKPDVQAKILTDRDGDGYSPVFHTGFFRHEKRNAPDAPSTLRCEYALEGVKSVRQWLCFSHPQGSGAQRKAAMWWVQAGGQLPVPNDVEAALDRITDGEIRMVTAVRYKKNPETNFDEVTGLRFGDRIAPAKEEIRQTEDLPF